MAILVDEEREPELVILAAIVSAQELFAFARVDDLPAQEFFVISDGGYSENLLLDAINLSFEFERLFDDDLSLTVQLGVTETLGRFKM